MEKIVTLILALVNLACMQSAVAFAPLPLDMRQTHHVKSRTELSMSTMIEPALSAKSDSSFEGRMRNIVLRGNIQKRKKMSQQSQRPKNLKVVRTLKEYKAIVGKEQNRIVAVRFFAPWCKVRVLGRSFRASDAATSVVAASRHLQFCARTERTLRVSLKNLCALIRANFADPTTPRRPPIFNKRTG